MDALPYHQLATNEKKNRKKNKKIGKSHYQVLFFFKKNLIVAFAALVGENDGLLYHLCVCVVM